MGQTIIAKGFCFAKGNLLTTVYAVFLERFKFGGWPKSLGHYFLFLRVKISWIPSFLQKLKFTPYENFCLYGILTVTTECVH